MLDRESEGSDAKGNHAQIVLYSHASIRSDDAGRVRRISGAGRRIR